MHCTRLCFGFYFQKTHWATFRKFYQKGLASELETKNVGPAADDSSRTARNDGDNSSMRQNDSLSLSEQIYGLVNGAKNAYLFRLLKVNILNNLTLVIIPS